MWKFILHLALVVWFKENIKVIFRAIGPIIVIIFIFTPLYWLWDPKLSSLGYGLYLAGFYTLLYAGAFIRAYFLLKNTTTNQSNTMMLKAKKAISKNPERTEKFLDLKAFPKLRKKSDVILDKKNSL